MLVLLLLPLSASAYEVRMNVKEKTTDNGATIYYASPDTGSREIDIYIERAVYRLMADVEGQMMAPNKKKKVTSYTHITCPFTRSGASLLSVQVTSLYTFREERQNQAFETLNFDLATGEAFAVTDLFEADSDAWAVMGEAVREQLQLYFPDEAANALTIKALSSREGLLEAAFTLTPGYLVLHYASQVLYPSHDTLMHVRIPLQTLAPMMTAWAQQATDLGDLKVVALTFDDGPARGPTTRLIEVLQRYGAQATFFCTGSMFSRAGHLAQRAHDEGHLISSHGYRHKYYTGYDYAQKIQADAARFEAALIELIGLRPTLVRAPGGHYAAFRGANIGMPILQWTKSVGDSGGRDAKRVESVLKANMVDGYIFLAHDIQSNTVKGFDRAFPNFSQDEYRFVNVEELFLIKGMPLLPNVAVMDTLGTVLK